MTATYGDILSTIQNNKDKSNIIGTQADNKKSYTFINVLYN